MGTSSARAATWAAVAAACLTLAGCATAPPSPAAGLVPDTRLTFPEPNTLRVQYRFESPVPALAFARNPDDSRLQTWRPLDPAFVIALDPETNEELIRRLDGRPFSAVAVDIPVGYSAPPKDYAPFVPFHEGGFLLHTGRLQACADRCPADAGLTFPMTITPPPGAVALLDGDRRPERASFQDRDAGRMIYVGAQAPIALPHVVALIDPALPPAFRSRLDADLPRLLDFFADRLGATSSRPELYVSLDPTAVADGNPLSNSFSSQGGVLPGQIFMHLSGDGWREDPALWGPMGDGVAWFLAHEAAHLFQHLQGARPDAADAWIHEGGADALAAIASLELGLISTAYAEGRVAEAADVCVAGIAAGALSNPTTAEAFAAHYACGMLVQLTAHAELASHNQDLFALWNAFHDRIAAGQAWTAETFIAAMEETGAPTAAALAHRVVAEDETLSAQELATAAAPALAR